MQKPINFHLLPSLSDVCRPGAVVPVLVEDILGRQLAITSTQPSEDAAGTRCHRTGVVVLYLLAHGARICLQLGVFHHLLLLLVHMRLRDLLPQVLSKKPFARLKFINLASKSL